MCANLHDVEVRRESYNHRTRPYWKIVTDATVSENAYSNPRGGELVSPPMRGEDAFIQLRKVLFVLNQMNGVYVDVKCGVHVHLSWADMTLDHVKNVVHVTAIMRNRLTHLFQLQGAGMSTHGVTASNLVQGMDTLSLVFKPQLA